MSKWIDVDKEDISIERGDLNVYVKNDYDGSIYGCVKIKDIKELLKDQTIDSIIEIIEKERKICSDINEDSFDGDMKAINFGEKVAYTNIITKLKAKRGEIE